MPAEIIYSASLRTFSTLWFHLISYMKHYLGSLNYNVTSYTTAKEEPKIAMILQRGIDIFVQKTTYLEFIIKLKV